MAGSGDAAHDRGPLGPERRGAARPDPPARGAPPPVGSARAARDARAGRRRPRRHRARPPRPRLRVRRARADGRRGSARRPGQGALRRPGPRRVRPRAPRATPSTRAGWPRCAGSSRRSRPHPRGPRGGPAASPPGMPAPSATCCVSPCRRGTPPPSGPCRSTHRTGRAGRGARSARAAAGPGAGRPTRRARRSSPGWRRARLRPRRCSPARRPTEARLAPAARRGGRGGALAGGRGALLVVPDHRDVARVDAALTDVLGPGRHVRLTADQGPQARYTAYLSALRGHVGVVVGTRAAAFAPVRDLGLVAWWDDGDDLHEEPRAPYPHVREILLARAAIEGAALLTAGFARSAAVEQLARGGTAQAHRAHRGGRCAGRRPGCASRARAARPSATPPRPSPTCPRRAGGWRRRPWRPAPSSSRCLAAATCRRCPARTAAAASGAPTAAVRSALARPEAAPACRWCGREPGGVHLSRLRRPPAPLLRRRRPPDRRGARPGLPGRARPDVRVGRGPRHRPRHAAARHRHAGRRAGRRGRVCRGPPPRCLGPARPPRAHRGGGGPAPLARRRGPRPRRRGRRRRRPCRCPGRTRRSRRSRRSSAGTRRGSPPASSRSGGGLRLPPDCRHGLAHRRAGGPSRGGRALRASGRSVEVLGPLPVGRGRRPAAAPRPDRGRPRRWRRRSAAVRAVRSARKEPESRHRPGRPTRPRHLSRDRVGGRPRPLP